MYKTNVEEVNRDALFCIYYRKGPLIIFAREDFYMHNA